MRVVVHDVEMSLFSAVTMGRLCMQRGLRAPAGDGRGLFGSQGPAVSMSTPHARAYLCLQLPCLAPSGVEETGCHPQVVPGAQTALPSLDDSIRKEDGASCLALQHRSPTAGTCLEGEYVSPGREGDQTVTQSHLCPLQGTLSMDLAHS